MQPEQQEQWQQPAPSTGQAPHPYVDSPQAPPPVPADSPETPLIREPREGEDEAVRWQALERISHDKDKMWFVWFGVITLVLILIALFLIRSVTFAILIPVMAAALVVYVRRPPAMYDYTLSRQGLHINDHLYSYSEFKEFGLVKDDEAHSVLLVPRKRFQPGITVYFPDEVGEVLVDMLASRLPMHEVQLDPIDRLIKFLRI